jgi:hypothetical protein
MGQFISENTGIEYIGSYCALKSLAVGQKVAPTSIKVP